MPKLSKSLPKYRKHRASGQAVVNLCGADHYLGPHGTAVSRREYDRLIAEWLARDRRGVGEEPTEAIALEVVQVLSAYWDFAQTYYVKDGKPTNELAALRVVMRHAKALFAHLPAEQFGPLALKAVRQRWIDRGQARTTINKNMRRLTRIFRWAAAEEMVSGSLLHSLNAVPGLKKGRCHAREPDPILPVAIDVVEQTIPHLPHVTRDMVRVQLLTGARPGEVCTLTPAKLDRSTDVWEYRVVGHKTEHHGKSRVGYIGPEAQAVLSPYLLRDANSACFSMTESLRQRRQARHALRATPLSCGNRPGKRSRSDRRDAWGKRQPKGEFDTNS